MACEKTGRRGRLIELDPKYVDTAVIRWQQFTGQQAVLENDGHTFQELTDRRRDNEVARRTRLLNTTNAAN